MSYEAWGDGDENGDEYDHLLEAGWLTSEQAQEIRDHLAALLREQIDGLASLPDDTRKKFLARISVLSDIAGTPVAPDILQEAKRFCDELDASSALSSGKGGEQ